MASANLKPFAPGQSGNPLGRPKGSRHKLSEAFLSALWTDWQLHGADVVATVRTMEPSQYLKIIASVVPKQIEVRPSAFDGVSDSDLAAIIAAARDSLSLH